MITLNSPVAPPTLDGYDVTNVNVAYRGPTGAAPPVVTVSYVSIDQNGNVIAGGTCTPLAPAAFEALPGTTNRLKALAAIAAFLGLAGGTYTTA